MVRCVRRLHEAVGAIDVIIYLVLAEALRDADFFYFQHERVKSETLTPTQVASLKTDVMSD